MATIDWSSNSAVLRRTLLKLSKPKLIKLCKSKNISYQGNKKDITDRLLNATKIVSNKKKAIKKKKKQSKKKDPCTTSESSPLLMDLQQSMTEVNDEQKHLATHSNDHQNYSKSFTHHNDSAKNDGNWEDAEEIDTYSAHIPTSQNQNTSTWQISNDHIWICHQCNHSNNRREAITKNNYKCIKCN
eukprot:432615_1